MKKIGNKLLSTYLAILIIVFLVSSLFFHVLSRKYIVKEAVEQLRLEGEVIANILKQENLEKVNLRTKIKTQTQLRIAGRFLDSELVVLNKDRKPIYYDVEKLNKRQIVSIMMSKKGVGEGYVSKIVPIKGDNRSTKGYIFMMIKLENIRVLNKLNRQAQVLSIIFASILAFILAIFFEKSITKPIKKLKHKMQSFKIKDIDNYEDIKTGDEIEELDKSFKIMANKIKYTDEQKKQFFQNTSHELKTPLMSIQGYAEAIKDGVVEGEELEESLDIIIQESQRLKKTVDELIYLTKLDDIEEIFKFEKTNLQTIIDKSIKATKSLANEKNITIEVINSLNIELDIDEEKMVRALINIIGNGIRYANSKITIEGSIDNNKVAILIKDDGTGFNHGEENKIFDRFYKGNNGNTGLGLAITKAIINGHNGNINAYNNVPKGAVFKIEL